MLCRQVRMTNDALIVILQLALLFILRRINRSIRVPNQWILSVAYGSSGEFPLAGKRLRVFGFIRASHKQFP